MSAARKALRVVVFPRCIWHRPGAFVCLSARRMDAGAMAMGSGSVCPVFLVQSCRTRFLHATFLAHPPILAGEGSGGGCGA